MKNAMFRSNGELVNLTGTELPGNPFVVSDIPLGDWNISVYYLSDTKNREMENALLQNKIKFGEGRMIVKNSDEGNVAVAIQIET